MTPAQEAAIRNGIIAETEPAVVAALSIRDDQALANWCNTLTTTDAWMAACSSKTLFELTNVVKYAALVAGNRDAWDLMLENAPVDFGRNKMRTAVEEIWGPSDSIAALQAVREKATEGQMYVGGSVKVTNTVSALDRGWAGQMTLDEMSRIMNGSN